MKSLELWNTVSSNYTHWENWLNKRGNDGTLLDTDDNVSFIDRKSKKAIKISYQPDDSYDFEFWNSDFDTDENKIDVLNIIFKDYEKAKNRLPNVIKDFIG